MSPGSTAESGRDVEIVGSDVVDCFTLNAQALETSPEQSSPTAQAGSAPNAVTVLLSPADLPASR
jgi:hypothetical protein